MASTTDLLKYLNKNNVTYTVLEHPRAFRAHETAVATNVPDRQLAKSIIAFVDNQYWMAVLRGDHRIDEDALCRTLGAKRVRLASEEDIASLFPDCEVGAMPPFGNLYALPVIVEQSLAKDAEIVFNACSHVRAIRMSFQDYERLVKPVVGEFAASPHLIDSDR